MNITNAIAFTDQITENLAFGMFSLPAQGSEKPNYAFTNGTGLGQVDLHWEHTYTLAGGAAQTLILSALTDDLGRPVAFARLRKFYLWITSRTDGETATLAPGGTHPFTGLGTRVVSDLDVAVVNSTAGLAVTASTADQVTVTNNGTHPMTLIVGFAGCSA